MLYNQVAVPCLAFVAQLYKPPESVIDRVHESAAKIVPAPGNWTHSRLLSCIKGILPFPFETLRFDFWALAAQCRTLLRTLRKWPELNARMSLAIASSDCIQSHFVLWARSCSVACLAASHDLLFKKQVLARDGSILIDCKSLINIDKGTREQVILYRHFKQELNFDPVKYTAERILNLGLRFFLCMNARKLNTLLLVFAKIGILSTKRRSLLNF